ncbi:MAG: hypothetical protein ABSC92_02825 [Rhizomicrobium sp.]|jgi:hypothetical protein
MSEAFTTVCVSLEDREDGGLRVFSTELPGLILSGANKKTVLDKIAPAITALFKAAKNLDVIVRPAKALSEVLDGKNPQTFDMNVQHAGDRPMANIHTKVFVVEYREAA